MNGSRAKRLFGDDGLVIVYAALMLVFFMVVAAIVVDLGNARQQGREATAAADAGALAGAQALVGGATMPNGCSDILCLTAYHTFQSSSIKPTTAELGNRTQCNGSPSCFQYQSGGATVKVENPYVFNGDAANKDNYVHVSICWDSSTSFGRVIGKDSIHVCGAATAKYTPGGSTGNQQITSDCVVEDNFATEPDDTPLEYVFNPGDWKDQGQQLDFLAKGNKLAGHDQVIAAVFDGHGTDIDLTKLTFSAPTKSSYPSVDSVPLQQFFPNDNKGPLSNNPAPGAPGNKYTIQSIINPTYDPATGALSKGTLAPYTTGGSHLFVIAYKLPPGGNMVNTAVYTADLHVEDSVDNTIVNGHPTRCGNAQWLFNEAGNYNPNGSTCGENSFFKFTPVPANGVATAGKTIVTAFFSDESPIQAADVSTSQYGIDLSYIPTFGTNPTKVQVAPSSLGSPAPKNAATLYGGGVSATNPGTNVPADSSLTKGYWLNDSDPAHHGDTYNTTIQWLVPAQMVNGTYKIVLKAYDTDNNKPGNDCGVFVWNTKVQGGVGNGSVNLIA